MNLLLSTGNAPQVLELNGYLGYLVNICLKTQCKAGIL